MPIAQLDHGAGLSLSGFDLFPLEARAMARRIWMAAVTAAALALAGPASAGGGGGIACGLPPEEFGKCVDLIGGLVEVRVRNLTGNALLGGQFTLFPVPGPLFGSPTIPFPTVLDPLFTPERTSATGIGSATFALNTPVTAFVGGSTVTGDSGIAWAWGGFGDVGDEFVFTMDADFIGVGGITQFFPGMDVTLDLGLGAGNPKVTFPIADADGFSIGTYHESRLAEGLEVDVCGGTLLVLRDGTHVFSCRLPFAVPLPPALALLGVGAGVVAWRIRRSRG
jgi:hypothetical protein